MQSSVQDTGTLSDRKHSDIPLYSSVLSVALYHDIKPSHIEFILVYYTIPALCPDGFLKFRTSLGLGQCADGSRFSRLLIPASANFPPSILKGTKTQYTYTTDIVHAPLLTQHRC